MVSTAAWDEATSRYGPSDGNIPPRLAALRTQQGILPRYETGVAQVPPTAGGVVISFRGNSHATEARA